MFLHHINQQILQLAARWDRADEKAEQIRKYYLEEYYLLEEERLKVLPQIVEVLNDVAKPYVDRSWYRAVPQKYRV